MTSLTTRVAVFCGLSGLVAAGIATAAIVSSDRMGQQLETVGTTAVALRNHTVGDMLHDSLRADVYAAFFAAERGGSRDEALKEARGHAQDFRDRIAANHALELPPTVHEELGKLDEPLSAYIAQAERIVDLAFRNSASGEAEIKTFVQRFEALEHAMDAAGDVIEEEAKAEEARAQSLGRLATMVATGGLALALVMAFAMVMLIKRSVLTPLLEIGVTMRKLSAGDKNISVPYTARHDEIGDMAQSILVFHEAILERDRLMQAGMGQEKRSAESRRRVLDQMIVQINSVVDGAARGDFAMRVSQSFDEPELKEVSARLNQLVATVETGLGETVSALGTLAGGDLTVRVTGSYNGAFRVLSDGTNNLADRLAQAMSQLMTAASAVDTATGEIAAGIDDLAERTADQATTVNETCDALGTFSASIRDNAQRASAAAKTVQAAEEQAQNGGSVLGSAREAMQRISSSSGRISDIVELIDGIAFQTNLLALNAAVEAARAGDVGRGFAVVASEVRTLAQRAAGASQEIKSLIGQAQAEIVTGVSLVEETSTHLEGIFSAVSDVTRVMTGIADASREQADTVADLTDAVNKMGDMAQQNAALVEETHAAILTTKQETQQLTSLAGSFRLLESPGKAARPTRRAA